MQAPSRIRSSAATLALVFAALAGSAPGAFAAGHLAQVIVIDRDSGRVLPLHRHDGRLWVEGSPGARYAIRVHNQSPGRLLAVMSVDGVNVISGETAHTAQSGYVLSPWERYDIAGWRRNAAQIAAFEFTTLADSYAARTGRPDHVGVLGVALFRERPPPAILPAPQPEISHRRDGPGANDSARSAAGARERAEAGPGPAPAAPAAEAPSGEARRSAPAATGSADAMSSAQAPSKLGTGHGQREISRVTFTDFQRAQTSPNEVITIHYDSRENLIALGVIRVPALQPVPRPFPSQPQFGFVPDPPRR
ncbi:MAG: hypothetical protein JNM79_22580 [Burkholderiales bacterium]|nr:hypothetical protein [Burkholderiales bacterium]